MTVCIAIGCDCQASGRTPKLILISDALLSLGGYTSAETGFKTRRLHKGWGIMFSGANVIHAPEVMDTARGALSKKGDIQASEAADAVSDAYQFIRRRQLENEYLKTYDMSMEEFRREGKNAFPESYHLSLLNNFDTYDLGCGFLIAGFDSDDPGYPCIFTVQNPGTICVFDEFGYYAIGSGDVNALTYLSRREQNVYTSYERSLYNAIAAKHLAEKAVGVGPDFHMIIQERGKEATFPKQGQIDAITKIWKEEEESYIPPNLESRIAEIIASSNEQPPQP